MEKYKIDAIKELLFALPAEEAIAATTEIATDVFTKHEKLALVGGVSRDEVPAATVSIAKNLISELEPFWQMIAASMLLAEAPQLCLAALAQLTPDLSDDRKTAIVSLYARIPLILQQVDDVFGDDWTPEQPEHPLKLLAAHLFTLNGSERIEAVRDIVTRALNDQGQLRLLICDMVTKDLESDSLITIAHVAIGELRERYSSDPEAYKILRSLDEQLFDLRGSSHKPPNASCEIS